MVRWGGLRSDAFLCSMSSPRASPTQANHVCRVKGGAPHLCAGERCPRLYPVSCSQTLAWFREARGPNQHMYHTEEAKVESLSLHSVHCHAPQPMQRIGCKLPRARTYAPSTTSSPNFLRSDSQNSMASSSTSPPGVSGWRIALSTAISTLRESNTYCEQGAIM